jgi:hypothetical protein
MLHSHSSVFNTRAFAICRNVDNQEWKFRVPAARGGGQHVKRVEDHA